MKKLYFFLGMMLIGFVGWGQVNIVTTGSYTQDFNTLVTSGSATWTDNSTISNWYAQRTGTGISIAADAGSANGGNLYSYGTGTNVERALGSLGSGNAAAGSFAWGVLLRNTSGTTITNITIAYTGEQWRNSAAVSQSISFYFKTNSSIITALNPNSNGTWTAVPALNFASPITGGAAGALDGNSAANRTVISAVGIPSLSLADNDYIMLKWDDPDHTGSDHGLSIDDVTISWTVSSSASINTGAVSTPPFCIDASTSAAGTVAFTSTGTYAGETFTAYLSDVSGSFPGTSIGSTTVTGTDPSGTINITIPAGTTTGGAYKIRIEEATIPITGSESAAFTITNGVTNNVTGLAASNGNALSSVSWTNPTNCFTEVMIVATAGSANSGGTPTGNGSGYNANLLFSAGDAYGNGYVVYKGIGSPQIVTGLTNGTTYYFKVFTRFGTSWSDGVEVTATPQAPTVYTWIGGNNTWTTPANWSPDRNTPAPSDILQFNDGATVTVTSVPTETFARLLLSNNTTVNLQAGAASNVLTIGGDAGTDLDVPAGSSLNIDGANALSIILATGATGAIAGNMTFSNAAHKMDAADASSITFSSPAVFTQGTGCTGNVFTTAGTANVIVFGTGTTFIQVVGSNPFGLGQPASKVVFQTGNLFKMIGVNPGPAFSGRTYANVEFAGTGNSTMSGGNPVSIDDLTVSSGTVNINMTGTPIPGHSIKGNISVAASAILNFNPATPGTMNLNGTSNQIISNSGTFSCNTNSTFDIIKPSGSVILNNNIQLNHLSISVSNTLDLNGTTLSITGNMTNGGGLTTGTGTVDFTGASGTQILTTGGTGAGKTFYNLSHSGAGTLQLATNDLRVMNSFTNNAGPFDGNNLAVTVGGNFSSTGTYTAGTGSLTFDGSANQDWSNNPANTYADVVINKSAGTVTLNNAVTMGASAILTLTSGTVTLGANNLALNNSAPDPGGAIAGSNPLSFVVTNGSGALVRAVSGAGTYGFPVGYSTAIQAAGINFAAPLGAANTLAARFITGWGGNNGLPLSEAPDLNIDRISVIGYWEIVAGSAFADLYTGSFVANSFGDIIDYSKLHLVKRADASSSWLFDGTHVPTTGTNPLAFLQRIGMSGFSQFAVAGESNIALPVTILHFSGYKDGTRNQLRWITVTEVNNHGFEIQRSTDGIHFSPIGFVNSLAPGGNSSDQLSYSFTDNAPAGSKQYYRLRQEDLAGAVRLSNIVLIRGGKPTGLTIDALFPNPAKNDVNLQISSPANDKVTILVSDLAGRNMLQQVAGIGAGSNTLVLNISSLQRGIYLLRIVGKDGVLSEGVRFVK